MATEISIPTEVIVSKIYNIRDKKVMLSTDLAELYEVEPRRLNEQVKRNIGRFPERYMFRLTKEEYKSLRSQNAILKRGEHSKYPPYAFTEHGVLMLSSVLRSKRAENVNILIIDTFVELNKMLATNNDMLREIREIKKKASNQEDQIALIFEYIRQFEQARQQELEQRQRRQIGYGNSKKED